MKSVKIGSLIVATMFGTAAFGQTERRAANQVATPLEQVAQQQISPEEKAKVQTDRLSKKLNLTADQYMKILELNTGVNMKIDAVLGNDAFSKAQKMEQLKMNNDLREQMIPLYLDDEQKAKFELLEEKKEMRQEMR